MPDTVVDRMVVELETNLDEALRGFDKAEQASDDLERQLEDVEKQSKKTATSIDKAGSESKGTAKDVDKLTKSAKDEGTAAKNAGDKTEQAGNEIEKTGNKSKNAANKNESLITSFKNMSIGGVAVIAAITAIVTAVIKIGEAAVESATKFEKSMAQIQIATGATGANLEGLEDVISNIYGSFPADIETITTVVGDLNTAYGLQGDELESLSRTYLSLAKVTGGDVSSQIETTREIFNKFGVAVEDQAEYLAYFNDVSQDTGVGLEDLLSLLAEGDRGFQLLGLDAKQSADVIGNAVKKDSLSSAQELVTALETGLAKIAGTSEAVVKSTETALASANEEYAKIVSSDTTDAIDAALLSKEKAIEAYNTAIASGDVSALSSTSAALYTANEVYEAAIQDRTDAITEAKNNQIKAQKEYDTALVGISGSAIESELLRTIELMKQAETEGDALVIGMDVFGRTLSGKVAGALFGGVLDVDLTESTDESIKSIEQLVEETITLDDKMLMLKADVDKALRPLGDILLDEFDKAQPSIEKALYWVNLFFENFDKVKEIGVTFIPMFHIMDTLSGWFSENGSEVIEYLVIILSKMNDIGGDSGGVMNILQTIWGFVDTYILTMLDSLMIFLALLAGDTDTALLKTYEVAIRWGNTFGKLVEGGINGILGQISNAGNSVLDFTDSIANRVIDLFEGAVNSVINAINSMISAYNSVASALSMPTLSLISTVKFEDVKHEEIDLEYSGISDALSQMEQKYADLQSEVDYRKELSAALKEAEKSGDTSKAEEIKTIIEQLNVSGLLSGTSTDTEDSDIYTQANTSQGVVIQGDLVVNSPAADATTMMNTTKRTLRNLGTQVV